MIEVGEETLIIAVADGVGGNPAGEIAAELAIETLLEALSAEPGEEPSQRSVILNALERAHETIGALNVNAATTVVIAEITAGSLRPYHVGDSMILLVGQRGRQHHVTRPHSPVGYAMHAGMLDESEAMLHEDRHLVSNLLGLPEMWIEVGLPVRMRLRDTLLLASDGLFDNLHLEEISEIIRKGPLDVAADRLAQAALARMNAERPGHPSKPDDLTFVLFRRSADKSGSPR